MDYVIRRDAITALSNYKDADSVLLLVSIINDTNEDEVNAGRALDALAVIGGSGTNKLLMQYYEQGRSEYIKNRALKAIVSGRDKVFIPLLREILEKHKSDYFKIKAYESLRSLGIRVQKPRLKPIPGNKSRVVRSD
jgi:HEAT repeat protein